MYKERTINIDSWRFIADVENPIPLRDQFPGWPLKISQFDNFGKGAENYLPEIVVNQPNQVIEVRKTETGDLIRIFRMKGNSVQVALHHPGTFTIKIGQKEIGSFETKQGANNQSVTVEI